jgi:hypothetical protein
MEENHLTKISSLFSFSLDIEPSVEYEYRAYIR